METTPLKTLECYFKTPNEHWNTFAYAVHCKAIEQGLFTDPAQPLQFVETAVNLFEKEHENPAKAVQLFLTDVVETALTVPQQLFIYNRIDEYLKGSEFDQDLTLAQELLKSHAKRIRKETIPEKPLVKNIRETLKEMVQKELEALPQTLKDLEPEKRLNIVCKLIPYVLPKVEAINSTSGEPGTWG